MLFAVILHDKLGQGALRAKLLPEHLYWLDRHSGEVLVAGSLRQEPDDVPLGGLWVVEAECKEKVVALMQSDPFFISGLRESYDVLHWSKAFPDRRVPV
jgi:uncharacterized protein YciI